MLKYVRAPGAELCPGEEEFRLEVAVVRDARRDLEFLPFDVHHDGTVLVRVTLGRTAGGKFRGTIEHIPPAGQPKAPSEEKVNSECEDLVRDLAFPASFFLPFLRRVALDPSPCPACPPAPPPPAPARPLVLRPACDPDRKGDQENDAACMELLVRLQSIYVPPVDPTFWLTTGGLMTLVYTSDPGPGFSLGGDLRYERWSIALEAQVTLPAPVRVSALTDADVSTFVGLLVPCVRLGETVRFVGCGVIGAGAYLSYDTQHPIQAIIGETFRLGPRAGLEVPLGNRFTVFASGEVAFAPLLHQLDYLPDGGVWTQSPASVFLSAGVSFRLGP